MSTAVEQSLQIALQEPVATLAVAVLLAGGLVGMSIRTIVEAVVDSEETDGESGAGESGAGESRAGESGDSESGAGAAGSEPETDPEELEHRLDDLETEVGSLSSTVDTVRNENARISESVSDVEESTGRLVDLFKLATRGSGTVAGADADGTASTPAGVDAASSGTREKHCVDSDEEVIDVPGQQDAFQANAGDGVGEQVEDIDDDIFESQSGFDGDGSATGVLGTEETIATPGVASDGGTALAGSRETGADTTVDPETPDADTEPESAESASTPSVEPAGEPERADPADASTDVDPEPAGDSTHTPEPAGDSARTPESVAVPANSPARPESQPADTGAELSAGTDTAGKPYLDGLPEGFGAELLTVEWLEFLATEVGIRETARAIDYYETIGWLTEDVASELDPYLDGLDPGDRADLSAEHHLRTLAYVDELATNASEDTQ